jgi:hypothetical protein
MRLLFLLLLGTLGRSAATAVSDNDDDDDAILYRCQGHSQVHGKLWNSESEAISGEDYNDSTFAASAAAAATKVDQLDHDAAWLMTLILDTLLVDSDNIRVLPQTHRWCQEPSVERDELENKGVRNIHSRQLSYGGKGVSGGSYSGSASYGKGGSMSSGGKGGSTSSGGKGGSMSSSGKGGSKSHGGTGKGTGKGYQSTLTPDDDEDDYYYGGKVRHGAYSWHVVKGSVRGMAAIWIQVVVRNVF